MPKDRVLELAWLAGIVDGEGHLAFTKRKRYQKDYSFYGAFLRVAMCSRETLERVALITDSSVQPRQNPGKQMWSVEITGTRLTKLLQELIPHMTTKKQEALLLLEALSQCPSRRGVPLNEEDTAMREGFHLILKQAKLAVA